MQQSNTHKFSRPIRHTKFTATYKYILLLLDFVRRVTDTLKY
jgi:hypothetical protein